MPSVEIRFLGQSGVRIAFGETVVYVDLYLSDHVAEVEADPALWRRLYPPPVDPGSISDATAVLCSHEHADHLDPQTLEAVAEHNPSARVLVPAPAWEAAAAAVPTARLVVARGDGDVHHVGPMVIRPVPAAHSRDYGTEATDDGHRWLGYVIEVAGRRIYHAGDTVRHDELVRAVRAMGPVDVALMPINGRDAYRDRQGIVGNLWPREAVELALELEAAVLVPLHHDLFAMNGITTGELHDYRRRQGYALDVVELGVGETLTVAAALPTVGS